MEKTDFMHESNALIAQAKHIESLQSEIARLQGREKELVEALDDLMSFQNGPPLPTYEKGWAKAMEKANALLSGYS